MPQHSITKFPLAKAHLSLFIEDEQAILFNACHQALYQLSPLSVALLLAVEELDNTTCLQSLSHQLALSKRQVKSEYQQLTKLCSTERTALTYKEGRYPELDSPVPHRDKSADTYLVAQTRFAIIARSANLSEEIAILLAPCVKACEEVDVSIEINQASDGFQIIANGLVVASELRELEVMPLLIDRLQILSFQHQPYSFCFHGAALKTPQATLLLPGKSGAGKSTLCAHLANERSMLVSDELIVFDSDFNLLDLPLPIAIKSGSWSLFSKRYPELEQAPEWHRRDGRRLKYLWPAKPELKQPIKPKPFLLVNPQFDETAPSDEVLPKVHSLSVIEALNVLTQGGYQVGKELNEARLNELIDFLSQTPCYQLSYQSTEQAMQGLDTLWP